MIMQPCAAPGCKTLVPKGPGARCAKHALSPAQLEARRARQRQHDAARRANAPWRKWYGRKRWRLLRAAQLKRQPLCEMCQLKGRATLATIADHITPHRGDERLFHSPANLQSLCAPCHDGPKRQAERKAERRAKSAIPGGASAGPSARAQTCMPRQIFSRGEK